MTVLADSSMIDEEMITFTKGFHRCEHFKWGDHPIDTIIS
jgi:hypothetical protein